MKLDAGHGWSADVGQVSKEIAGTHITVNTEGNPRFHWNIRRIEGGAITFSGSGECGSFLAAKADAERIGSLIAVNREAF